jgi:hypothetical protein
MSKAMLPFQEVRRDATVIVVALTCGWSLVGHDVLSHEHHERRENLQRQN